MLKKKHFGIAYLFMVNMLTVLVGLICIPLLAGVFTPEQFGQWSIVVSVASLLSVFVTLQLEQLITVVRHMHQVCALTVAILALSAVLCVLFLVIGSAAVFLLQRPDWQPIVWISSFLALEMVLGQLMHNLFVRGRFYKLLANRLLFLVSARFIMQLGLGMRRISWMMSGLIAGEVIVRFIHIGLVNRRYMKTLARRCRKMAQTPFFTCSFVLHRWGGQAVHIAASRVLGDCVYMLLPIVIGILYGVNAVGQFNIAHNAVIAVVNAFLMVISSVFMAEVTKYYHEDIRRFRAYYFRTTLLMLALGVLMYVFSLYSAKYIIDLMFHKRWANVYTYFIILLPALSLQLATGATPNVLNVVGKSHWIMYVNLLWNILLWPFAAFCLLTGAPIELFLRGLAASVAIRCLANVTVTSYWVVQQPG